ncbi:hypothetical protein FACS189419_09940 [Planctomycetales bacterium]|nr:hypothetical protein FACS189419_09940 [Planctomycetales bacterium]
MKQGEIWKVNLDPVVGAEIRKTRPALIVSVDELGKLPLKVIVPVTDWKDRYGDYAWMIKIKPNSVNGLTKDSAIDCFQIRSVSVERLVGYVGKVDEKILSDVQDAVGIVVGLN